MSAFWTAAEFAARLAEAVPQTAGEAVARYGAAVVTGDGHEWDNRTTPENALWLLGRLAEIGRALPDPRPPSRGDATA